jgi:nicotinate phosphoribosyltransferase
MSLFDKQRLTNSVFKLDIERMRRGWYTDKYFTNIAIMLTRLAEQGYRYQGCCHKVPEDVDLSRIAPGNIEVEMQWFTRRPGKTLVVGVDKALAMLQHCTGYWEGEKYINTSDKLQVWAVQDGSTVIYPGDPTQILPVIRVRGRYRDFAILETPTLGALTPRQTRSLCPRSVRPARSPGFRWICL